MTQTRILELGKPTVSPRAVFRRTVAELLCILFLGALASVASVGVIEWASHALVGR